LDVIVGVTISARPVRQQSIRIVEVRGGEARNADPRAYSEQPKERR
jgi:hypothetical protein